MLKIRAEIFNSENIHNISVSTNEHQHGITIESKPSGFGSSANGGEMLFLALATCYCNDIYREAAKRNIQVESVQVDVQGEFKPEPGSIAENIIYHTVIEAQATEDEIIALARYTDTVAEVQNTLRRGIPVKLDQISAKPV